jgi:multicomponent Na+:H+ antiporter subunit F
MIFSIELSTADFIVLGLMMGGIFLSLIRFWSGPSTPDRIIAVDTISILITASLVVMSYWFDNPVYLDVALVYGVLAFVGIVALARLIERGRQ